MSVVVQEASGLKKSENSANSVIKTEGEKDRATSNKRANKQHFTRGGSFRNKHRIKLLQEIEAMAGYGKGKNDSRFWRIRHFGHFDLQSVSVDRVEYQSNSGDNGERLKKHTGASAAILNKVEVNGTGGSNVKEELGNDLVAPCPSFTNELGSSWLPADSPLLRLKETLSQEKKMRVYSRERAVFDGELISLEGAPTGSTDIFTVQSGGTYPLEYMDYGACYYRNFFYGKDHLNFVGSEDGIGPIVISFRRQKVTESYQKHFFLNCSQSNNERVTTKYQYRVIVRTSELPTLRGAILEETIPSSSKASSSKGIPPREVIEYVTQGEIQISSLKLAKQEEKVHREIMRLDEQALTNKYKIGVLYCKAGQTSEEEWYNNEHSSPAFDEFLELIGSKVKMKGFSKYRAQLDNKTDTTGEFSVFQEYENSEMMFHVSTLLPFTENNKQQLLRKRHIGNDIVTLIFQEPGSEPFSPKAIRSHFQHIFIIVRVNNPNTPYTEYKVAVSRSSDVPYFGPPIPESGTFQKSDKFRNFLLTKLMNACNAALQSDKLYAMAARTRKQYLNDIVKDHATHYSLEQIGGGALGRLFGRKREKSGLTAPLLFTSGAITWNVSIITRHWKPLPFSEEQDFSLECILALATDVLIFIDNDKTAILHIPTKDISGFSIEKSRLNLFYDNVFCLSLEFREASFEEDIQDFCKRLMAVSNAQEAILLEFSRSVISGMLGFTIDQDGAVVRVDGLAKMRGLQKGARVLQVEDKLICSHTHKEIISLLHNKHQTIVRAYVIPPVTRVERPYVRKAFIDWDKVLSLRPQMASEMANETEDKSKSEKGSPPPSEISDADVLSQKCYSEVGTTSSHAPHKAMKNRKYKPNHLNVKRFEDDEIIYDRLLHYDRSPGGMHPPGSPSNRSVISSVGPTSPVSSTGKGFGRVKITSHKKPNRQSVIPRGMEDVTEDFIWAPVPAVFHIEDHLPRVTARISQSTTVPDQSRVASPLSAGTRKPVTPGALGERNPENLPHHGTVQEMTRKFSEYQKSSSSSSSPSRNHRKYTHVPVVVRQDQRPSLTGLENMSSRSPNRRMNRPQSCELVYKQDNVPIIDTYRGESLPPMSDDDNEISDSVFRRSAQARLPFRNKATSNPPTEIEYEFDRRTYKTEDDNTSEATPVPPIPLYATQSSGDESLVAATKVLEELEKYMSEEDISQDDKPTSVMEEKINKLSVRARTHLWEMKAHNTQTLPRSFKSRTKSQPCSPLKTSLPVTGTPATPTTRKISAFTFNTSTDDKRDESEASSLQRYEDDPSAVVSRTSVNSVGSPSHRTLPLPIRKQKNSQPMSNGTTDPPASTQSDDYPLSTTNPSHTKQPQQQNAPHLMSPIVKSENQFVYDRNSKEFDQLTWDVVMGDISNYCRNVAEWVRQTESAGVLDTPPPKPDSPTFSETCSFTTTSFQSETSEKLKDKVERLEDKLDKETESNKELRYHLKKMEKQITELQRRQTVKTKV